jgi:predicted AAA+ superfamily ATPase
MIIQRNAYLKQLIDSRHNHLIKIVTGLRRCGKSFLLFEIFTQWLEDNGVPTSHIIHIDLEDRRNRKLHNPDALIEYIDSKLLDNEMHYIMIDEIQYVSEFEDVLNSYLKVKNADVYVTGSNARFLSKDVITTFRGRGDEIRIYPLSFKEFMQIHPGSKQAALNAYLHFGGMPQAVLEPNEAKRSKYLKDLFTATYIRDIIERYNIKQTEVLEDLLNILASAIGGLTNPSKLANTFESVEKNKVSRTTLTSYIEYICDSFLISKAARYDVKGKKYMDTPYKFYYTDLGLRNARLNFRQFEPTHLMENLIYNELLVQGYNVDVGVVTISSSEQGKRQQRQHEVDFVCNLGSRCYYIQSAYKMLDDDKIKQETASLRGIGDNFKKIVVVGDEMPIQHDSDGITYMSIYDFLLKDNALEL